MDEYQKNALESVNVPIKNTDKKFVWHSCDQCTYKAKHKYTLKQHIECCLTYNI